MMTGERMVAMADEWIAKNPTAWEWMNRRASMYASEGRRFSMERLLQDARYEFSGREVVDHFKVNNNSRSALARKIAAEHPECKPYMDFRRSAVDDL